MRASVVKSPEISEFDRQTSIPTAGRVSAMAEPAEAVVAFVTSERITDSGRTRPIPRLELAAAVECDLTQATTNSYTCQPQATDHQIMSALRSASRSPEASEPPLTYGFR